MLQQYLVRDEHIEPLADGVMTVLEQVGILCQNDTLLEALRAAGAQVEMAEQRARFPRRMVEEFVAQFRSERQDELTAAPFVPPGLPRVETQVAQYYYDHNTGKRRSGNTRDFIECIKLGEVLHGDQGVAHALLSTDVPPLLEPLNAALLLTEYASNPCGVYPWDYRQIDYLIEMGEILGRPSLWTWGALCFAHPLRLDRDVVNRLVRMCRDGAAIGITAMPVAGVSTPVTVEGFIAVAAAEVVSVWIAGRCLNPEAPLAGSMWAGTVDMKTGGVSYSAFDAMYYAFSVIEFLRRWTGISIPPGSGEYCDSKEPGMFAALEKHYKAMTVAAFTGHHPPTGQGMLECGKTLAPVQLLLERDLTAALGQYGREISPTLPQMGLESILEVDLGLHQNHLQTMHTLQHFRQSLWLPELVERAGWSGPQQDEVLLQRAQHKLEDLWASYRKPEPRDEQIAQMRAVMERAARELA
ncbi:MAG: trimethylamine methyltransferase family protein [Armatimonadia bacterium]